LLAAAGMRFANGVRFRHSNADAKRSIQHGASSREFMKRRDALLMKQKQALRQAGI